MATLDPRIGLRRRCAELWLDLDDGLAEALSDETLASLDEAYEEELYEQPVLQQTLQQSYEIFWMLGLVERAAADGVYAGARSRHLYDWAVARGEFDDPFDAFIDQLERVRRVVND